MNKKKVVENQQLELTSRDRSRSNKLSKNRQKYFLILSIFDNFNY